MFQTEYEFTLPKGYVDVNGKLHKEGVMRLSTAADEIVSQKDPRVTQNQAFLIVVILSKVITRLGDLQAVDTRVIERLFSADLMYLQGMYQKINELELPICQECGKPINFTIPE